MSTLAHMNREALKRNNRQKPQDESWGPDRGIRMPTGHSAIGIDITDRFVCASQLDGRREGSRTGVASLRVALRIPRAVPGHMTLGEAHSLAGSLKRAGVESREVVLAAPDASLMTGLLELPPRSSKAPLDEIARMELARMHRADPDSFTMACWDMPASDRTKGTTQAMGIGLSHDSCNPTIEALEHAGLTVSTVDARMCAIARAVAAAVGKSPALVGVVEVGWSAMQVLLLHGSSTQWTIAYERRVPEIALSDLAAIVQSRLGLDADAMDLALRGGGLLTEVGSGATDGESGDPEVAALIHALRRLQSDFFDQLVPEVQRSLVYATQRYSTDPLASVQLTGEGAQVRGLRTRIAQALSVECGAIMPRNLVNVHPNGVFARDSAVVASIALAAHPGRSRGQADQQSRRMA